MCILWIMYIHFKCKCKYWKWVDYLAPNCSSLACVVDCKYWISFIFKHGRFMSCTLRRWKKNAIKIPPRHHHKIKNECLHTNETKAFIIKVLMLPLQSSDKSYLSPPCMKIHLHNFSKHKSPLETRSKWSKFSLSLY